MNFRRFLSEDAFPHEIALLRRLPKMDMYSQAAEDQAIHDRAIAKGTFDAFGNNFLAKDKQLKQRFQILLQKNRKGERIDPKEKAAVARLIHDDKEGHQSYISHGQFTPDTGSEAWHHAWIDVYDKWLDWLNKMGTNY